MVAVPLLLAACNPAPEPTLIDINQAATQTARAQLAAPETLPYPGVSLSGLERYRAVLAFTFAGSIGGVEKRGSLGLEAVVDLTRPAAQGTVSVGGDAGVFGEAFPQVGMFGKVYLGGVDYITGVAATGADHCLAQSVNRFDPLAYNVLSPDQFLPPGETPPLTFLTREERDGALVWRFRAERFSTSTLETAALDVWTTEGGARVAQLDLQGWGRLPGQDASARGAVTLHYELTPLDQPPDVALPAACAAVTPAPAIGGGP